MGPLPSLRSPGMTEVFAPAIAIARSGQRVRLNAPVTATIRIDDIAEHLGCISRWAGAAPYSVAQHSVHVAEEVANNEGPAAALYALLHDGHESYLGDITEPVLSALELQTPKSEIRLALTVLRAKLDRVIHEALDLDWPPPLPFQSALAAAHARVVASEFRDLLRGCADHVDDYVERGFPPLARIIRPWTNHSAADRWLKTFTRCAALSGLSRLT